VIGDNMDIPQHMLAQARTFCSIQPCPRFAEGDLTVEQGEDVRHIAVCARHAEYYVKYFGGEDMDAGILSQETVFVDDVGDDKMLEQIVKQGNPHAIIRP
jgi:hypothetical protein